MTGQSSRAALFGLFQDFFLLVSILSACALRFSFEPYPLSLEQHGFPILVTFIVFKASFHYFNLYEITLHLSLREFVTRLLVVNITGLVTLTMLYFFLPQLVIGRGILALTVIAVMVLSTTHRLLWGVFSTDVRFSKNVLVLGDGRNARIVLEEINGYPNSGYNVIGVASRDKEHVGQVYAYDARVVCAYSELVEFCRENTVDLVVVALDEARGQLPVEALVEVKVGGARVVEATQFHEQFRGKIVLEGLRSSWFIFSEGFVISRMTQVLKRTFDLTASFILLVLTAPLCFIVTILIKLTSPGPILYRQERVGLRGRTFILYKFRSMRTDSEVNGPQFAQENDPRVTSIGRFIRRFRVDEIPQILNVFNGEMSFVGPRPERPFFVRDLSQQIPFYSQRHVVKPGITGWAQVRYPYGANFEDSKEKLQLDLYYIKNLSVGFDLKILFETVGVVLGKMKVH